MDGYAQSGITARTMLQWTRDYGYPVRIWELTGGLRVARITVPPGRPVPDAKILAALDYFSRQIADIIDADARAIAAKHGIPVSRVTWPAVVMAP